MDISNTKPSTMHTMLLTLTFLPKVLTLILSLVLMDGQTDIFDYNKVMHFDAFGVSSHSAQMLSA